MSNEHLYIVSLPYTNGVEPQPTAQFGNLQKQFGDLGAALRHFIIPPLKIGTLDSLMEASDELAKLDPQLEGTITKLATILEEASERPKNVCCLVRPAANQQPMACDVYLKAFSWYTAQYDTRDHIRVLIEKLAQVGTAAEERIRGVVTEYSDTRNRLANASRKGQGNLATRSINDAVKAWAARGGHGVLNTEFLQTIFVAVPSPQVKEFLTSYASLHEFITPGSASTIAEDREFTLFSIVAFKKSADDVKTALRKKKFLTRDLDHDDGDGMQLEQLKTLLEQQKSNLVALIGQQFSLTYQAWAHVKALRIFVESMLKYGLPPKFIPVLLAVDSSKESAIRKRIAAMFPELRNPLGDEHHETGALQYEFPYVSLKVSNVTK